MLAENHIHAPPLCLQTETHGEVCCPWHLLPATLYRKAAGARVNVQIVQTSRFMDHFRNPETEDVSIVDQTRRSAWLVKSVHAARGFRVTVRAGFWEGVGQKKVKIN